MEILYNLLIPMHLFGLLILNEVTKMTRTKTCSKQETKLQNMIKQKNAAKKINNVQNPQTLYSSNAYLSLSHWDTFV